MGLRFVLILLLLFLVTGTALPGETERRIEEEARVSLEQTELKTLEGKERLGFDYGGWLNFRYVDYKEDDNDSSAIDEFDCTSLIDSRIWLKATLKPPLDASYENEHFFYLRVKDLYSESRPDETAGGGDHDGPHLDYAYLTLDAHPLWMTMGRQYFSIGRGIAYSNVNDGLDFLLSLPKWGVKTFIAHTLPHEENIDLSVPGYDKDSDRFYYGLEYSYLGIAEQNLYGYVVIQRDYSNEHPEDAGHDYTYNSEYFGLGAEGKIKSIISYWLEIIKERGKSFVYDTNEKKDVDAWASVLGVTYGPEVYSHPGITFEYAFGSGDPDRASVTDTQYGNTSGKDKNFLYLGYIPTGYALSPRLSNLYFYRLGLSLKPLENNPVFKRLTLGADYYRYYKHKSSGGIYDTEATEDNKDVGSELDLNLGWHILSDLTCYLQYGHFRPGKAYPDATNDSEDYFSASMIFTF